MERIIYNSKNSIYKSHFGALPTDKKCTFSIDIHQSENPTDVAMCVRADGRCDFLRHSMTYTDKVGKYLRYSCEISFELSGLYFYRFEFLSHDGMRFCGQKNGKALIEEWLPEWQLTVYDKNFSTPQWAKNKIMYQIFPDRFYRSHNNNYMYNPVKNNREVVSDWFSVPKNQGNDFFMGNLRGIIEKLPYIKETGADIIYLNPIFESPENHRYSTGDYFSVDPFLGTNEDFSDLCKEAKKLGIRIILDGVFSHTGADSLYFNKYGHYKSIGAYQGKSSPYYNWYNFTDKDYECWWGFENLPNVNETHPDYMEFITGDKGVLSYWQNMGASGWRLDVADELPDEFLDALRCRVKKQDKNALIIGEVWEDATNKFAYDVRRRYLLGAQMDSVMNYPWRTAIINYVKYADAEGFRNSVMTIQENYPKPCIDCLMNIISTHDTERILNATGVTENVSREDAQNYILSEDEISRGIEGTQASLFLLFSLPGIACIYYGDEVGAEGFSDPYCRKGFPYGKENTEILNTVKELAHIRKNHPEAFSSLIKEITIQGGALVFERGELMFVINMSESDEIVTINSNFVIICNKNNLKVVNGILTIPKKSYGILCRKSP